MSTETEMMQKPEFQDLTKSYGPGKFDDYADAYLYELVMDGGGDEEVGEAQYDNYHVLVRGPFEHPQLQKYKGAIQFENSQGFVSTEWFTSKKKLDSEWKRISREVESETPEEDAY